MPLCLRGLLSNQQETEKTLNAILGEDYFTGTIDRLYEDENGIISIAGKIFVRINKFCEIIIACMLLRMCCKRLQAEH